jgi:tetraacyldisaccharide 4'-kinase
MRLEPPSWWYEGQIPLAAWGLLPVSALYGGLVERRFRIVSPYRSKLPVICVGNFTMGGAGKTPVALKLASLLRDAGRRPAFLTRGYGGSERGPHVIDSVADNADRVGDEPLLLARTAPTVVSRYRPAGARLLETLAVDTIIMDDGFQNPSLEKTFSLVVVDGGSGIGSGRVFPLGPLRAPLAFQAERADTILILGGGKQKDRIIAALELEPQTCPGSPPFPRGEREGGRGRSAGLPSHQREGEQNLRPARPGRMGVLSPRSRNSCAGTARALPILEGEIVPLASNELPGRRFLAFCGIGRPMKFFDTLRQAGVTVVKTRGFPDHHPYMEADAISLLDEAEALDAGLLTTEKDHARLNGKTGALEDLYRSAASFPITIRFSKDDEARLMLLITAALSG